MTIVFVIDFCTPLRVMWQMQKDADYMCVQVRRADLHLMRRRVPCQAEQHCRASSIRS